MFWLIKCISIITDYCLYLTISALLFLRLLRFLEWNGFKQGLLTLLSSVMTQATVL